MRRMPWTVYLWPGLPQLVGRGSWSALVLALGAAALLNTAILGTFAWNELLTPSVRILCWMVLAAVWIGSAVLSGWLGRLQAARENPDPGQDLFSEATDSYLQGNWFETERVLTRLLRRTPRDLEARLMLATMFRHTKRWEEASRQLNVLLRLEGSRKWELEIRRERELLMEGRLRAEAEEPSLASDGEGETARREEAGKPAQAA
jgi:hypothetical protein